MFTKTTKRHTILYRGFEIDPVAETHGEGNGWYPVPEAKATFFEVYPLDEAEEKVDEAFETLAEATAWIDAHQ